MEVTGHRCQPDTSTAAAAAVVALCSSSSSARWKCGQQGCSITAAVLQPAALRWILAAAAVAAVGLLQRSRGLMQQLQQLGALLLVCTCPDSLLVLLVVRDRQFAAEPPGIVIAAVAAAPPRLRGSV